MNQLTVITGDCRTALKDIPDESVQCCVTSPPYFGLRNYNVEGQIGLETTPADYVAQLLAAFAEVWRVLRKDGTLWLNLGDSYANDGKWGGHTGGKHVKVLHCSPIGRNKHYTGLKQKDLIGIPWMVAFALRESGWYLRQDIIWSKPNPMPESVTDRCTKSHEYIFLLTKSQHYLYNAEQIAEPLAYGSIARIDQDTENQLGSDRVPGKTNGNMKAVARESWRGSSFDKGKTGEMKHTRGHTDGKGYSKPYLNESQKDFESNGVQDASATKSRIVERILSGEIVTRNKRSVWTVTTKPFNGAHFATFPTDLIKPCILAGSKPGDIVLDPFAGSGTCGLVALELGRRALLVELNPDYVNLIHQRCHTTPGLPLTA